MDALRHGNFRLAALLSTIVLCLGLAGCGGDDGNDGAPGAPGADGSNGFDCWDLNMNGVGDPEEDLNQDGNVDVLDCNAATNTPPDQEMINEGIAAAKVESCETCHKGAGDGHQAVYDKYTDTSRLELLFDTTDVSSVDNGDGSFTVSLNFTILFDGQPFDDPNIGGGSTVRLIDQRSFYTVQYFPATREYLNSCSLGTITWNGNGTYTATGTGVGVPNANQQCSFAPELSDAQVYGYIADNPLFTHTGGAGAETPAGTHVHLYDDQANTAVAFGAALKSDPNAYVSAANVEGCITCHGSPYLKHGYRAAVVDNIPDFAACKDCHFDNRNGGHDDWQWMVDDPYAWATGDEASIVPADRYAYTANIMNDVHMSHAMEFPFPSSMSNCNTCHKDKLDQVLADEEFTAETCKSCHAVQGIQAWPPSDVTPEDYDKYAQEGRPPPLEWIWAEEGVDFHTIDLDCQLCHVAGTGVVTFKELHSGYWDRVYMADGTKYADVITASIDDVSVDLAANTITITFSASDEVDAAQALLSFYGWDTKNFIIPSHAYDLSHLRYEQRTDRSLVAPLFSSLTGTGTAADPWVLVADLAAWVPGLDDDVDEDGEPNPDGQPNNMSVLDLIDNGTVTKAQVTILPRLTLDGTPIALTAVNETIDLAANAPVPDYFAGDGKIVDPKLCNVCHLQLGATFHTGSGRGGEMTMCRNCHNPTFAGSHLEMASRSIENYVHTIHSFQDFDTDDIFATYDPVRAARYNQHIQHVFPNFTITNCEACHVPGSFNPPDQSKTMPGLLQTSYDVNTWYGIYPNDYVEENLRGKPYEKASRAISGDIPQYAVGPTSRACGGCHRARLINQDAAGALGSWNAHTAVNGTYSENDEGDNVVFGVITKIMDMF